MNEEERTERAILLAIADEARRMVRARTAAEEAVARNALREFVSTLESRRAAEELSC